MVSRVYLFLSLTCKKEEYKHHDEGVSEVKKGADKPRDGELRYEVVDAVDEEIDSRESTSQERSPPPVVVLERNI